jgi:hypothetical protein
MIDPENEDGFALMWGGVRSNYGIVVPSFPAAMATASGDGDGVVVQPMNTAAFTCIAIQIKITKFLSLSEALPFGEAVRSEMW